GRPPPASPVGPYTTLFRSARAVAERSLAAEGLDRLDARIADVNVDVAGDSVTVTVRGRARYLFAKALPGGAAGMDVTSSSTAHRSEEHTSELQPRFDLVCR